MMGGAHRFGQRLGDRLVDIVDRLRAVALETSASPAFP